MSDDELRAAAQEMVDDLSYLTDKSGGIRIPVPEHWRAVALGYLAEHPSDNEEPVTDEWLRSVGFDDRLPGLVIEGDCQYLLVYCRAGWYLSDDGDEIWVNPLTKRSHVRRLCAALGVPLQGREQERG